MKDMMTTIHDTLLANPLIAEKVSDERIKFYEAPETLEANKPFIIIDAIGPQKSAYFAANKVMSKKFTYQISVETKERLLTKEISSVVEDVMRRNGFGQLDGGLDEYFKETKRFVDARRYRKNTTMHDTDY